MTPTLESSASWHAAPVDEVVRRLDVDPSTGLDHDAAAGRHAQYGPNQLVTDEPRSDLELLVSQFTSPLIYILLVAFVVTMLIAEYTDAAVIAAALALNATVGFIQERRADRSLHALMELASPRSDVVRGGVREDLAAEMLVPGDVVLLESGTRVPADLRVVEATSLTIDESLLTGESEPTTKRPDPVGEDSLAAERTSIAHMGSAVSSGRGRGVVVAIATETELGRIAESIRAEEQPATPLQRRMGRFANIIAVVVLTSTLGAFALGLALGEPLEEMFLTAVALAVAVVPEGLPVAFTVAMALGVRRMAHRHALIRSLPAVETLGSTDTIGSDKTGTLTANQMSALRAWTADGWVAIHRDGVDVLGDDTLPSTNELAGADQDDPLSDTLRTAVLSNESELLLDGDRILHRGDPTETALLEAAHVSGFDVNAMRAGVDVLVEIPFESDRRYSSVVVDDDGPLLRLKGAPERVVAMCSTIATSAGPRPLDAGEVLAAAERMAERGLRVLAMARARIDHPPRDLDDPPDPEGLTLTGLVGMQDPPRAGVRDAIDACRAAGIRVIMITGDHVATARAIARELGISDANDRAITGHDLETMSDDELRDVVHDVAVFARVAPEHKLRVVRALRDAGDVVAVTGDGVNDAPALKAAHIGVAMGQAGTDVAREASDMVLTDDNFVSIANAVEEGRVVFDNVRKVTYFLLSTGAAAIVAIVYSIAAGLPLPYVPAALLWLNVVTSGVQDIALAFEPAEPDVLDRPPRPRTEGIVSPVLWERTALLGTTMAAGSLWLFRWALATGLTGAQARGAALTTLVVAMAVHAGNARSERRSVFAVDPRTNPFLLAAVVLTLGLHVAATYWSPIQSILQVEPVTGAGWVRVLAVAVAVIAVSELHKLIRSRRAPASQGGAPARTTNEPRRCPSGHAVAPTVGTIRAGDRPQPVH